MQYIKQTKILMVWSVEQEMIIVCCFRYVLLLYRPDRQYFSFLSDVISVEI